MSTPRGNSEAPPAEDDYVARIASELAEAFPDVDRTTLELSYRLGATRADMQGALDRLFAGLGVPGITSRFPVLRVLYFAEGHRLSLNAVKDRMNVSPPSVTYLVDGLEKDGLVEREPDASDRRVTRVALTARGLELCQTVVPALARHTELLAAGFSEEDKAMLLQLLRRYQANARAAGREPSQSE